MVTPNRQTIWILTMAAFLIMTSGCARTSLRRVEEEIARGGSRGFTRRKVRALTAVKALDVRETRAAGTEFLVVAGVIVVIVVVGMATMDTMEFH